MKREDIEQLARSCGITLPAGPFPECGSFALPELLHMVRVAIEAEREACAKVCEAQAEQSGGQDWYAIGCLESATSIRARPFAS